MRVGVVGGGIGGLAVAIALRKEGIEALVFERSSSARPTGGGFVLWSNGMAALAELGIADGIAAAGSEIERFEVVAESGRLLAAVPVGELSRAQSRPTVCATRARLWEELAAALGEPGVRFGSECQGFVGSDRGAVVQLAGAMAEDV